MAGDGPEFDGMTEKRSPPDSDRIALLTEYSTAEVSIGTRLAAGWQLLSLGIGGGALGLAMLITLDSTLQVSVATTAMLAPMILALEILRRQALREHVFIMVARSRMREIERLTGLQRALKEAEVKAPSGSGDQSMEPRDLELSQGPGLATAITAPFLVVEFAWLLLVAYRWTEYAGAFDRCRRGSQASIRYAYPKE